MKRADARMVRQWLLHIMSRLPMSESTAEAEARAQLMAPSLADSYPLEAFTIGSANHILIDLEWFREADIRVRLNRWRQVHLPDLSSLPDAAATAPVDDAGRNWIARWLRSQTDAAARSILGLIRSYHTAAYAHLVKTDTRAAGIVIRHGWPDPTVSRTAEWADEAVVLRAVQTCYGHYRDGTHDDPTPSEISAALQTLRELVGKFAPQNLHLIPIDGAMGERVHGHHTDRHGEATGLLGG